jgi:hypothetical protein
VIVRGRVEVQLRVRDRLAAVVVGEHVLKVADPHVVGDDRQVGADESLLGEPQVADGRGERLGGIEAVVDLGSRALELRHTGAPAEGVCPVDLGGELPARGQVDVHAEQRLPGLGKDLGETGCVGRIAPGDRVRLPGTLEEDDPLQRVRVDVRPGRGGVDQAAEARHAGCGGDRAPRALDEQSLRTARGRPGGEVRLAAGNVGERVS